MHSIHYSAAVLSHKQFQYELYKCGRKCMYDEN